MQVLDYQTAKATMGQVRTMKDIGSFLRSDNPHKMGIMATLHPDNVATLLTEGLKNTYFNEKKGSQYQPIDTMSFEWGVDTTDIKKIYFAKDFSGTHTAGTDFVLSFTEKYFDPNDTFMINGSRQLVFVVEAPIRKADNCWDYTCRLIDNDYKTVLNTAYVKADGLAHARWHANYTHELSEKGYAKFQSNVEKYRNHMSMHRVDVEWSSEFEHSSDTILKHTDKKEGDVYFRLEPAEKLALDNMSHIKNMHQLFGRSTMDLNGKSTLQSKSGYPIIVGDGAITQIEKYCDKHSYGRLTAKVLEKAIFTMAEKSEKSIGNNYTVICNRRFYRDVQVELRDYLSKFTITDAIFFSKEKNDGVKVGTNFTAYEFGGNKVTFVVDNSLSKEYGDRGYAVCINLAGHESSGKPAMAAFTLKGRESVEGTLRGFGSKGAKEVSSRVAGSVYMLMSYTGIAVFAPYRSFILEEAIAI